MDIPADLAACLHQYKQEHVLKDWDRLDDHQRDHLIAQLRAINLAELQTLFAAKTVAYEVPARERIQPIPVQSLDQVPADIVQRGEDALRRGEVAALVVAGGQGSRLGFHYPKGMFPIGPVSQQSLFYFHASKVLALSRRYGKAVPLLVMTSPATHQETLAFFQREKNFGLKPEQISFFQQGTMPALDLETGKLIMEKPGVLFTSPNGHGGTLKALADSGLLAQLKDQGIRQLFYFQVDNPLVKIAEPAFLGLHLQREAEVSVKVIDKEYPKEKMGVFVLIDGKCAIIEYSDLSDELAELTDADGRLVYRAGNPAIHLFDLNYLERITQQGAGLPFHVARKKVPYLDARGETVKPTQENALKFEMFIFDALPLAQRWLAVQTTRDEEFSPVKNAEGNDSPATARQAMRNLAGRWLEHAGVPVERDKQGNVVFDVEIAPTFALNPAELKTKLPMGYQLHRPAWLKE